MTESKPWMVETIGDGGNHSTQYAIEASANRDAAEAANKPGVDVVHIHKWIRLRREWQFVRTVRPGGAR